MRYARRVAVLCWSALGNIKCWRLLHRSSARGFYFRAGGTSRRTFFPPSRFAHWVLGWRTGRVNIAPRRFPCTWLVLDGMACGAMPFHNVWPGGGHWHAPCWFTRTGLDGGGLLAWSCLPLTPADVAVHILRAFFDKTFALRLSGSWANARHYIG